MNRSQQQRQQQKLQQQQQQQQQEEQEQQQQEQQQQEQQQLLMSQQQMVENEAAVAAAVSDMFDLFCMVTTMKQILGLHRNMCNMLGIRPGPINEFYTKLKAQVRSWKAQALWKKFDARASHRVYAKGNACTGTRVLVIGAGPCGLRTAIEAQLLGAKVVVLEKRDRISRNNVLHLWPFVITDLRNLGAKKFYGKFCAGSIDHISIRQLQCILMKVALLLGVEIHEGVSFDKAIEPCEGSGWRAGVSPADHVVSHYEFDVLIGADGKRNTLEGFKRKEFRGKLAIAITANFVNKKTEAEAKAEEISGVAFIFNQSFFKELYAKTGIDLENIVYYKDETHYFVMTAKKHSLIDKGVIIQDYADPAELLKFSNVNKEKLYEYAREAAQFSTKYQMPNLEFAVNHYGNPDVAMFDFTSMFAAETSCRAYIRNGYRLLQCLVGDSLLEPFWPTGSGCARGFLSSMDAAYAIKLWTNTKNSVLGVVAQRESIYRLLNQTTPENLQRDIGSYTVDPSTRYPNLNRNSVNVWQVKTLIDTDDPAVLEQTFMDPNALQATPSETPVRRKRRSGDSTPLSTVMLRWVCAQLHSYEFIKELKEVSDIFTNGKVLCALINRYRPDLVAMNTIQELSPAECNEYAFKIFDKELHIPRVMTGKDSIQLNNIDTKIWLNYLEQICEAFRGEIPAVKHPKMDFTELKEKYRINHSYAQHDFSKLLQISSKHKMQKLQMQDMVDVPQVVARRSVLDEERAKRQRRHELLVAGGAGGSGTGGQHDTPRRAKKRRSVEKTSNIVNFMVKHMRHHSNHHHQKYFSRILKLEIPETLFEFTNKDRDRGDIPSALPRGNTDEQFNDRIKSMEQQMKKTRNTAGTDKKPKDLMRAIGKIDSSDWNVREIEKKIEQSKKTEIHGPKGREKVPKWSKEQFLARQNKMARPTRQDSAEEKFKEIDQTLKNLDKQLKEGSVLEIGERGRNKVASIAGQFKKKDDTSDEKNPPTVVQKSNSKVALAFKKQAASEKCHFCKQTVYLMEKITTEGLILHRSCLKCHHCHTNLRAGGYAFDRDDPNGRFYCTQHFRLPAKAVRPIVRKSGQRKPTQQQQAASAAAITAIDSIEPQTPKTHTDTVTQLDLLDRGQTPERIEFENTDAMSDGEPSEEHIIDEHEWSGRNFLPESNNDSESNLSSSDESDSETDSDMFEEANDSPLGVQTLQLATDWIGKQNYTDSDDSDDFYDSSEGIVDDGKDDTDGEEFKKARELRREEVRLLPLPANLPTDTETEVPTESESTSPDEVELNSATEISTDSEFDNDEIIRETPKIFIDDTHLRKPTKVQVKSTIITPSTGHNKYQHHHHFHHKDAQTKGGSYLQKYQVNPPQQQPHIQPQPQFKPLVQVDPSVLNANRAPLQNPRPGDYLLNKTASTEGIASKKSLELKKRYLLGEPANGNKIQKSGSTSVLDSKIRSFQSNISECQKLLNPGTNISPSMKTFLDRTKLGENANNNELMRSATNNILNDLKVEITIQKASSTASTDNEKENVFVNSKNELNKGMEYSETINTTLLESLSKKSAQTSQAQTTTPEQPTIIETIDLVTPEKQKPIEPKTLEANIEFIESSKSPSTVNNNNSTHLLATDSNKVIDLTLDSPVKSDVTIVDDLTPDVSKDVKETIPDILGHIENEVNKEKHVKFTINAGEESQGLLSHSGDEEKCDSPEKVEEEQYENESVQIQVPNIPWKTRKSDNTSSNTETSCSSNSSSIEDIQHYILESTTSPDTQHSGGHLVPRVEVHDTSGTLMQIDSLMIIDGKYIGDPEDLKYIEIPDGVIVPEVPAVKTIEVEDETEIEPVTATPEPADCTVIEADEEKPPPLPEQGPPLPERGPPKINPVNLKFDTRNENKIESLKNLPLIVEQQTLEQTKAVKPVTLNLSNTKPKDQKLPTTPTTPTGTVRTPTTPQYDNDKTPTGEMLSRGSDSETEHTGTGQVLTETELSDWTADDCISENFVDMEFVLNSNKGTMKRNKKNKRRSSNSYSSNKLPSTSEVMTVMAKTAPVAEFEGILKSIDIDDIEFMDTGSEGSCAETYAATNAALLRNRGYMEYFETTPTHTPIHKSVNIAQHSGAPKPVPTKHDEELGIDYIEQGAYIMQGDEDYDLKTPVNENPQMSTSASYKYVPMQISSVMTQSLTDSSTLNDIEDDSLCVGQLSSMTNTKTPTTTEESEALTIVTSPIDSSSPKAQHKPIITNVISKDSEAADGSTPSSSEKNPRTSQSTGTQSSTSTANTSSKATPTRRSSIEAASLHTSNSIISSISGSNAALQRKQSEEISYEEYVRALQHKITQISTASPDSRKQRRKSSKGESPANAIIISNNLQSVIDTSPTSKTELSTDVTKLNTAPLDTAAAAAPTTLAAATTIKVPEIPTLTRKLEEITKERTKQKDLIHDLVMDKLQSKKQLNAEKRLHRSRQRNILTSGYASGSSMSPTPKIAAATTTTDTNCASQAHYHASTAVVVPEEPTIPQRLNITNNPNVRNENNLLQKSATYVSPYGMESISPTRLNDYKQRPFSEHIDPEQLGAFQSYKLSKTPSFSYALPSTMASRPYISGHQLSSKNDNSAKYSFVTPIAQLRQNRGQSAVNGANTKTNEESIFASTENLRSEARARARLKSNSELGLSPEEKMQLLRKRLLYNESTNAPKSILSGGVDGEQSSSYIKTANGAESQLTKRDLKMSTSKSVNDIAYIAAQQQNSTRIDEALNTNRNATTALLADFTSDPNLLLSSTSPQANNKAIKNKTTRRQKDPERRKSLIQSLSSFFHKSSSSSTNHNNGKDKKENGTVNSAQTERPGTSASNTTASGGSVDGIFNRFRISPRSKEKSKDKDGHSAIDVHSHNTMNTTTTSPIDRRSNSQDCIKNTQQQYMFTTPIQNIGNTTTTTTPATTVTPTRYKKKSTSTTFSSSSPQLFVTRTNYMTTADDQTPPPIPPLPLNYQRSDDESYTTETREQKKQRAISKAVRQAELKRLRIAQEIQREQEEIEVELKELEARGVLIEKALRGEVQNVQSTNSPSSDIGSNDEKLLKELLEIWRNITHLKKRDEELGIRQQELQLEHRHAQLKEELDLRLSCNKLDKSSSDVAAEGAILNEMLEIVAKRAALRPTTSNIELESTAGLELDPDEAVAGLSSADGITFNVRGQSHGNDESNI